MLIIGCTKNLIRWLLYLNRWVFFSQIGDFYSKFVSYKTLCMQLGQIKPCTTLKKGVSCKEELSPYHNYTCISLTIVICLSGPLMFTVGIPVLITCRSLQVVSYFSFKGK